MKKWLLALLTALLLVGCAAQKQEEVSDQCTFYYPTAQITYGSEQGVIGFERRKLSGTEDVGQILSLYFEGPTEPSLTSPFPMGTRLESWRLQDGVLTLNVSVELSELSGLKRTIACSCISKTCLQWEQVRSVCIYSDRMNLSVLPEGQNITSQDVLLTDDSTQRENKTYTLFYLAQNGRYLIGEEGSFRGSDAEICRDMVARLLLAPENSTLFSAIPEGSRLLDVRIEDGLCTLDFSSEFENGSSWDAQAQRMTLLSLVNTLTQLESIDSVAFCEEGTPLYTYRFQDLSSPWVADSTAIGPVRTSLGEMDTDLYIPVGSQGLLAPVPVRVSASLETNEPRRVLEALLGYRGCNGYESAIAPNVSLLSLTVEERVAMVELSSAFLESEDPEAALRSVTATLCALKGVGAVTIVVEGAEEPLAINLSPDENWCY